MESRQRQYLFAEGTIRATESTLVTLGLRRQYASDKVEILSGMDQPSDRGNHLTAWQLGVRQDIGAGFGAYAGRPQLPRGQRRRTGVGEIAAGAANLHRQGTGPDLEVGQEQRAPVLVPLRPAREIQYNPLGDGIWGPGTGGNINLDPTRRQGIELEGHHALTSSITLDANLTWMEAKFRSGTYSGVDLAGKQVPLVPKWLANAGVTWRPTDALLWNVSAQYVGKSRMDNDQANQFGEELNAYVLFNTKLATSSPATSKARWA